MLREAFKLAIRTIRRNAMRSFLTVLGIVIGVGAVIGMVTTGQGTTAQVTADMAKLGTNLLMVRTGRGFGPPTAASKNFSLDDVNAMEAQIPGVRIAVPSGSRNMTAIYGNENYNTSVTGSDNRFFDARQWTLAQGRFFQPGELSAGSAVCVIGETVRKAIFGKSKPIGETIRLEKLSCNVVGLLASKGASTAGPDQDDIVVIPLRMFQRRVSGNRDVSSMIIVAKDGVSTTKVQRDVQRLLRERRRIKPGEDDDFDVMDTKQMASTMTSVTSTLTGLLSAVAAVSLLVGGIGIMNIMLVSVTERTREIGIRLAIGAQARQVLLQFLVEAVVLSLFGGLAGIAAGLAFAAFATSMLGVPYIVDVPTVIVAFAFSALVGIVFGYFPAQRASRLNPIDALRHE
ncbi:MAG: ABC transporter permease [Alphaproteobacteria bacterium]|jgi:putative ABC transport system permease protein|nr:ABC transporter permease [Alphaproteobacteria bacterium]